MVSATLHGFALGFAIALTPGPMFFLCLRRTLSGGWRAGLLTGLGIATADGIYAAVAAGGIGVLGALLAGSQRWITLAGGVALVALGAKHLLPTRGEVAAQQAAGGASAGRPKWDYLSALALTLTNPATIVSFGAIFAAIGVRSAATVGATAAGSLTWWVLVVLGAARLRGALGAGADVLRLLSGLALVAFGVVAVLGALLR